MKSFKNFLTEARTQASLEAKKFIIEEDEYEKDLRRILNYGHSFGHALESLTKNEVTHGFGVLFGMDLINKRARSNEEYTLSLQSHSICEANRENSNRRLQLNE